MRKILFKMVNYCWCIYLRKKSLSSVLTKHRSHRCFCVVSRTDYFSSRWCHSYRSKRCTNTVVRNILNALTPLLAYVQALVWVNSNANTFLVQYSWYWSQPRTVHWFYTIYKEGLNKSITIVWFIEIFSSTQTLYTYK